MVKILSSIHLLLSDAESLRQRYGLETRVIREENHDVSALVHELAFIGDQDQMSRTHPKSADEIDPSPISKTRMKSFINEFQALQLRMHIRHSGNSKTNRLRWIVADKAKFEVLIYDLTYFTTKLHAVLPTANNPPQGLAYEDLRAVHSLRELKILLEASAGRRVVIASSTQRAIDSICGDRILNSLCEPVEPRSMVYVLVLIPSRVQNY